LEIEDVFTAYLLTQTALTALIGQKIEPDEMPSGTELPYVTFIKISDVKDKFLTAQNPLEQPIFQFTAYGATKAAARAVANQLKAALVDYVGTLSGIVIQKIELQNELSSLQKSPDGVVRVYTEDLEFQISFLRS